MSDTEFLLAVLVTALAVLATRIGGAALMAKVPAGPKVERFLEGLSVSVIAALVASLLIEAETRIIAATLVAVAAMALTRSVNWAMFTGIATAATYPFVQSFIAGISG